MKKHPPLFILLLLASFAAVSAVIITPALPQIAQELNISAGLTQLVMTFFLFGYALGNLPYGPLSNRYGRKPTLYLGIAIAILGSLIVLLGGKTQLLSLLIVGRFLSALGSTVGLKITFTMIGDIYNHTQATKKISMTMLAFAIAPGLAIATGGFLTSQFGWQGCFYFLLIYSFFLLFLSLFLPETASELDYDALSRKKVLEGFSQSFRNKKLIICALLMGCSTSIIYLFASEAPFIGINRIGLKPEQYGLLNFIPPLGIIFGSTIAHRLAEKIDSLTAILAGILIALSIALLVFILFFAGFVNTWVLFLPMPFLYTGLSMFFTNASSTAMHHAKNKSYASAVMNFINMGISTLSVIVIETLPLKQSYILPLLFVFLTFLALLLRLFGLTPQLKKN